MSAEERREQIIQSARRIFQRSGLAGARTRDLAAEAGVNEALLYRHFDSKEALFEAAVATPLEEAVTKLVQLSGAPPTEFDESGELMHQRTYQFTYDLLGAMEEIAPLLGIVLFGESEHATEYFRRRIEPTLKQIQGVVEANLPAWPHRTFDARLIVEFLMGMAWFTTLSQRLGGHERDRSEVADAIAAMILEGLRAHDPGPAES
ncbi:Transcriptional regulator, TetR family [Hoyosella subflava DQS3-9A1]|uniref:Transcriptional regulator, TetR family n=1 Tax=Hoyosella subflava (strain DSM 45089 / JCM 17490 / NBRC 109087 / DQS3-9A1) TaxID=443218 RepID=F6ELX3_HOYSD|nr:Transcriptional regulator, TetR family [Hoyosella subflava DQS3-9A1]